MVRRVWQAARLQGALRARTASLLPGVCFVFCRIYLLPRFIFPEGALRFLRVHLASMLCYGIFPCLVLYSCPICLPLFLRIYMFILRIYVFFPFIVVALLFSPPPGCKIDQEGLHSRPTPPLPSTVRSLRFSSR